jgi:predicted nucleic acid-binding protein
VKPSVYIETTVVSYLVGRLNPNDLNVAAHQEITRRWWSRRRDEFELYASSLVVDEVADGDPSLAAERLRLLRDLPVLQVSQQAYVLKSALLRRTQIPLKAENDALHIAVAAVHGIEFLTTWNCKHIANAMIFPQVYEVCRELGFEPPLICTPYELLGEYDEEI